MVMGDTDCQQLSESLREQRLETDLSIPWNGAHLRTAVPASDPQLGPQDSCLSRPSSPKPGTPSAGHLVGVQHVFDLDKMDR